MTESILVLKQGFKLWFPATPAVLKITPDTQYLFPTIYFAHERLRVERFK